MDKTAFRTSLAEFLAVDVSDVTDEALLEDLGWDSLALLSVVGLVEEQWGVEVSEDELNGCSTVGQMLALFDSYW